MTELNLVALSGSLRKASFNRMALNQAIAVMPAGMRCEVLDWRAVPLFDADMLQAEGLPASVRALGEKIAQADGLLIATPEYNFSMPGVFKNLLDWISRIPDQPLAHKPVAVLSASPGVVGGARVQYDLRRTLLFLNAMVLQKPEVFVTGAAAKFSPEGQCTDANTIKVMTDQMLAFSQWIAGVKRMRAPG